jgi:outer membrane lipase/esterase
MLGLPDPQASLNGGTNYAYAGAKTGLGTNLRFPSPTYPLNPPLNVDRVGTQINSYITDHTSFQSNQLVLLWSGANDLRDVTGLGDILTVVNNLESHIRTIDANGGKTIVVPNQLDFSLAPFFLSDPARRAQALFVVTTFNTFLAARLDALENDPSLGIHIISVDMFGLSHEVAANPAAFGFTNVTDPVVTFDPSTGTFSQVSNPDGFLFYDLIHPTAQFHQLIAQAAVGACSPKTHPNDSKSHQDECARFRDNRRLRKPPEG